MTDNMIKTQKSEDIMDEGCVGDVGSEDKTEVERLTQKLTTTCLNTSARPASGDEMMMEDCIEISGKDEHNLTYFDSVIGAIEDIVMGEDFHVIQRGYLDKYWPEFSPEQTEHSHSHFVMFKEYSHGVSSFIEDKLKSVLENFDMETFVEQLGRRGDLDGDIFEMLFTLIDYIKFRELMLDYRAMQEGTGIDLSQGISVRSIQIDDSSDDM